MKFVHPTRAVCTGIKLSAVTVLLFAHLGICQDEKECRPYRWNSNGLFAALDADEPQPTEGIPAPVVQPGEINCRYWLTTSEEVNYYTCSELSQKWSITNEKLFFLNPTLKTDCSNIRPQTKYCVRGFTEPLRALDGRCGPQYNNATCIGTAKQCCNSLTWTCGDSTEDCAPGTCYEGDCAGHSVYTTDGNCGWPFGRGLCAGRWGKCCSQEGKCGDGDAFCGLFKCLQGDCDIWKQDEQPAGTVWTKDGYCGGEKGARCSGEWGRCCNVNGVCGEKPADCYLERGCQPKFGVCGSNSTASSSTSASASSTARSTTSSSQISSGTTVSTSSAPSASPTGPIFVAGGGNYTFLGCYREPSGGRALPDRVAENTMTIERCLTVAAGRAFAGVEYGSECWMGNGLRGALTKVDESNCKMLCAGNSLQYCGSGNHLVLYSTGLPPELPSHPRTVNGSTFHGCMTEATGARALSGGTFAADDMTLDRCAAWCGTRWRYFGVEYARECFCGDVFNQGSVLAAETDCNMPCAGNGIQLCGGGNRLSVYGRA